MKPTLTAILAILVLMCSLGFATVAQDTKGGVSKSGFVTASDGARIHYVEAGKAQTVGSFQAGGQPPAGAETNGKVSLSNVHQAPALVCAAKVRISIAWRICKSRLLDRSSKSSKERDTRCLSITRTNSIQLWTTSLCIRFWP